MKFTIAQHSLNQGVNVVQRSISSRSHLPILDGILIRAQDNKILLTGTNLDMSIELTIPAMVEEKGLIVVNSRLFSDIIKRLPDTSITIEVKDHMMTLHCASSHFELVGYSGEEYPSLPLVEGDRRLTLPSHVLREAIRQTVFAVAQDNFRPIFTGILFEVKNDKINVVALDGYRLAKREIHIKGQEALSIVIPGKNLIELSRILESIEDDVTIEVSMSQIKIAMPNLDFYSILLEGEFFRYEEILRNKHSLEVKVNRQALMESVERASLLAREDKANLLKLTIEDESITISSNTEVGSVEEVVPASYEGDSLKIAFNSKYLLDGIKNMDQDEILLKFSDNVNPLIIQGVEDGDYLYLVLPVRLAKEE